MTERPIIFGGPMVRAILEGRKTQTRRVVKATPRELVFLGNLKSPHATNVRITRESIFFDWMGGSAAGKPGCPYGQAGDRLWVRETWYDDLYTRDETEKASREGIYYRADHDCSDWEAGCPCRNDDNRSEWRSPIHMPRWASRLLLEIKEVRVERLQSISEEDAKAEGVDPVIESEPPAWYGAKWKTKEGQPRRDKWTCPIFAYRDLWEEINGTRAPWASNPWVWCLTFSRVQP